MALIGIKLMNLDIFKLLICPLPMFSHHLLITTLVKSPASIYSITGLPITEQGYIPSVAAHKNTSAFFIFPTVVRPLPIFHVFVTFRVSKRVWPACFLSCRSNIRGTAYLVHAVIIYLNVSLTSNSIACTRQRCIGRTQPTTNINVPMENSATPTTSHQNRPQ